MHSFYDIATAYAARGWAVFPCKGKEPLTQNGFKDASTNKVKLVQWFGPLKKDLPPGIAIATGAVSGIIVLDIDVKNGGLETLELLKKEFGHDAFYTYTVKTGGGGYHFYFKHPGGHIGNRVGLRPGVDLRADGGYVVAPPSLHDNGHEYETVTELPLLDCHEKLLALVNPPIPKDTFLNKAILCGDLADTIAEGGRNNYLTKLSGRLQRSGLSPEAIHAALMEENERRCEPPLPQTEVAAIAKWVQKYIPQDPVMAKVDAPKVSSMVRAGDLVKTTLDYLQNKELLKGLPTGLTGLDKLLGGGKRLGEITAWQAEAKTGKNTLWHALQYLYVKSGIAVGYASREMSPDTEVLPNFLSLHFQRNVLLSPVDHEAYRAAIEPWPLYFAKGYGYFPIEEIIAFIQEGKKLGITHFWFDHLHYMISEPEDHKEASKLIKLLKTAAKQENVHIDIIIQPNKLPEDNKKLSLNTMKGGAAIAQAVDNMIVLERMRGDGIEPNIMVLELQLGRSSLCRPGKIYLKFNPETRDFTEIAYEHERPPALNKQWTRPSNFVRPKQPVI